MVHFQNQGVVVSSHVSKIKSYKFSFPLFWLVSYSHSDRVEMESVTDLGLKEEEGQDGRVRWYSDHLPLKTHEKYIYTWNNTHRKLTGNRQKDSYKVVSKIYI